MADSEYIDTITPYRTYVSLKFKRSLLYSSVSNANVTFSSMDDSPTTYEFKEIQVGDDYNSISRVLKLEFETLPPASGEYNLTISGLKTTTGETLPEETHQVTYDYNNQGLTPEEPDFTLEDNSIKSDIIVDGGGGIGSGGSGSSDALYIESTEPADGEIFVADDFGFGTIVVNFSEAPRLSTLNSKTVKVQRKEIGGSSFRWETIPIRMALDADLPSLYIYLPSLDDDSVYYDSDRDYFESGYKYRVLLSKAIAS